MFLPLIPRISIMSSDLSCKLHLIMLICYILYAKVSIITISCRETGALSKTPLGWRLTTLPAHIVSSTSGEKFSKFIEIVLTAVGCGTLLWHRRACGFWASTAARGRIYFQNHNPIGLFGSKTVPVWMMCQCHDFASLWQQTV